MTNETQQINPKSIQLYNQAIKFKDSNNIQKAVTLLKKAIKISPSFYQAYNNLGTIYLNMGVSNEALKLLKTAAKYTQNDVILNNLGRCYSQLNMLDTAEDFYQKALAIAPGNFSIYLNLSLNLMLGNREEECSKVLDEAVKNGLDRLVADLYFLKITNHYSLTLSYPKVHSRVYSELKAIVLSQTPPFALFNRIKLEEIPCLISEFASFAYDNNYPSVVKAIIDNGAIANACKNELLTINAKYLVRNNGDLSTARTLCIQALQHNKNDIKALSTLADIAYWTDDQAMLDKSLAKIKSLNSKTFPMSMSIQMLNKHKFKSGWHLYSTMHRAGTYEITQDVKKAIIKNKKIALVLDQGIGDEVMFSQFIPRVIAEGPALLHVSCDNRILDCISRSFDKIDITTDKTCNIDQSIYDEIIYASQLPYRYIETLNDFPGYFSYLKPKDTLIIYWEKILDLLPNKINVGIAWKGGNSTFKRRAAYKSATLMDFLPILEIPHVNWINLQYGNVQSELEELATTHNITIHNWIEVDPLIEIENQLALISNLDLVIQVSNASVHFAGALGINTWCVISNPIDFRWFPGKNDEDTPWYPSMSIKKKALKTSWKNHIQSIKDRFVEELSKLTRLNT